MWFPEQPKRSWVEAERHLRATSPALRRVIDHVGPCTLAPRRDYFVVLCKAIFTQQISTAVATVLFARFRQLFPSQRPTPQRVLELIDGAAGAGVTSGNGDGNGDADGELLRRCGLSRQKRAYVRDLAEHFATKKIPTRRLGAMSDAEVIEALTEVKGIGCWTAEMFLIFTLNRPDVLPVDDLGLQKGAQNLFALRSVPDRKKLIRLAEPWRPYRSIATWYLWRGFDLLQPRRPGNGNKVARGGRDTGSLTRATSTR